MEAQLATMMDMIKALNLKVESLRETLVKETTTLKEQSIAQHASVMEGINGLTNATDKTSRKVKTEKSTTTTASKTPTSGSKFPSRNNWLKDQYLKKNPVVMEIAALHQKELDDHVVSLAGNNLNAGELEKKKSIKFYDIVKDKYGFGDSKKQGTHELKGKLENEFGNQKNRFTEQQKAVTPSSVTQPPEMITGNTDEKSTNTPSGDVDVNPFDGGAVDPFST